MTYGPVPVDVLVLTGGVTGQEAPVCVGVHELSVPGVPLPEFDNTTTRPATTNAPPATASQVPLSKVCAFSTPAAPPGAKGVDAAKAAGAASMAAPAKKEISARFTLNSFSRISPVVYRWSAGPSMPPTPRSASTKGTVPILARQRYEVYPGMGWPARWGHAFQYGKSNLPKIVLYRKQPAYRCLNLMYPDGFEHPPDKKKLQYR